MQKFLRGGATVISGGTFIPESRVAKRMPKLELNWYINLKLFVCLFYLGFKLNQHKIVHLFVISAVQV